MKIFNYKLTLSLLCLFFLISANSYSQKKRQLKPKRDSKIESVDEFVNITYTFYNKVFVHDSLTQAGVEIPSELEDELIECAENDLDSLWQVMPNVIDDIANSRASFFKKGKATLNLNKAKRALKYCAIYTKKLIIGTNEEEQEATKD